MNALQLCPWQFSHSCYGWGATLSLIHISEPTRRTPISYRFGVIAAYCSNFAPTRPLWLKISGRRGRPPPIIFAPMVKPMNALQLCSRQFSHSCYAWGTNAVTLIQNFWYKGSPPPIFFARLVSQWMPYNFAADSFHTKKLCSRLSSSEVHFLMKICRFAFLRPLWGT